MLRAIAIVACTAFGLSLMTPVLAKPAGSGGGGSGGTSKPDKSGPDKSGPDKSGPGKGGGKGTGGGGGGGKNKDLAGSNAANRCPDGQTYRCRANPIAGRPQICGCTAKKN